MLVHGFKSSPVTWESFRLLVAGERELAFVRTVPFSYDTAIWSFNPLRMLPSIDTVADSLKEFLDTECQDFDGLVMVTHSQGGLVVQRFLTRMAQEGRAAELSRIRRVAMLACPNNGSEIALPLRRLLVRNNPQEAQLRPLNEQVADTQRLILRDFVYASSTSERTCPIPFSVFAGESDNIVRPSSARSVFPDAAVLPGDHFTIVHMDTPMHRTYTTLRRLIRDASRDDRIPPISGRETGKETHARDEKPDLPTLLAVVSAAEQISDMDDPEFRKLVLRLMRKQLAPLYGFTAAYQANTRDHLVEIIQRCLDHRDPHATLDAFLGAVASLRPDERGTANLRAVIGEHT
ncbi:hypothetical protein [Streptomyces sp. NPDC002088]|uniref:DUF7379 domain-containing protein n=1 Tax=Streptomyces sp. NPDC002088 TaxID=3154665 RepID=UPI0033288588